MRFELYNSRFGPKRAREFPDGFEIPIDPGDGGGGPGLEPPAPLPPVTPAIAAQDVAGLFTPDQIDLAARFETQEGASLGIFYGKLLFGATNVVSHKYVSTVPKQNTFTVLLGEGWGGLGSHGEWNRIVTAWYLGEELTKRFDSTVWFDDALPAGATAQPSSDGWNWIAVSPPPYFGKYAHQSPARAGHHQHYFQNATQGLAIQTGDTISCYVWIDPVSPPQEIMLQFGIGGDFEHRAYWGSDLIGLGTPGTASRFNKGALPATGSWQRLDVLASEVGLAGATITGMSFDCFDGSATWDLVLRWKDDTSGNSGYIFRPGIIGPDNNDRLQRQVIGLWPSGLAYNGSAGATVRLSEAQSAQDRPDGFKCIAECRKTFNFDATGAEIDYGYSTNPARVAADRILHFFERRFRDNIPLAREKFRARVYWPSWVAWRDYCDQLIPWDRLGDGVSVFIKRFEANIGLPSDLSLANALDRICGLSATMRQDTGRQLIFLPPSPRAPIHHFHTGNVVTAAEPTVPDLRRLFNRFIARFRDIEDEFLGEVSVEPPVDTPGDRLRKDSIRQAGEIRIEREFPSMTQSQGMRLIEYRARLEHDNPIRCRLVGNAEAFHVLKGDLVTVSHPVPGWDHQLCLVLGITVRSAESSADEVAATVQKLDGWLYADDAHRPRQPALTLP